MSIYRMKLLEKVALAPNSSISTPWTDVPAGDTMRLCGLELRAPNPPSISITLRCSMFRTTELEFPPSDSNYHFSRVLQTLTSSTQSAEWFPIEFSLPIASFSVHINNNDAMAPSPALTLWAVYVPRSAISETLLAVEPNILDAAINNGAAESNSVRLRGTLVGLEVPAMATGTAYIGVSASLDGQSFSPIFDATGGRVVFSVSTNSSRFITIEPMLFAGFRRLRFIALQSDKSTSQAQNSKKTLFLVYRSL